MHYVEKYANLFSINHNVQFLPQKRHWMNQWIRNGGYNFLNDIFF